MKRVRKATASLLLLAGLLVLVVAMLLPSQTLSWLRSDYDWLGQPLNWLERLWPGGADLDHVAAFAVIALLWRLLSPRAPWWRPALWLAGLAIATELVQFAVPGRTPLLADVRDDLLGVGVGLLVAMLVDFTWRSGGQGQNPRA